MASCMALTQVDNLEQVLHIFTFLKNYHNSKMVFDLSPPEIGNDSFIFKKRTMNTVGKLK